MLWQKAWLHVGRLGTVEVAEVHPGWQAAGRQRRVTDRQTQIDRYWACLSI